MVVHSFLASRKSIVVHNTDLADRDKVLEQLRDFFGWENVVPISNYNTFKLKTLVKDIGKFYGVSFEETNAATRTVEDEVRKATMKEGDDKNLFVLTYDEAMGFHCIHAKEPDAKPVCQGCTQGCSKPVSVSFRAFIEKNPSVAESIKILFKQNRALGRHAGGVLIADDLPNKMPLVTSKPQTKGGPREPQTPWVEGVGYKHLEKIGEFIKCDLLGLETLRLIERTIELILIKEGNPKPTFDLIKAWYEAHMEPSVIDFNDPKPYEVYEKAKWGAIFQCSGQGARKLFEKAKPKSIIDIAALTSIYRPGPLAAHVDKLWLEHEEVPYDWGHPLINETLKETRGLLVFQEGVMALVNKVAGFPMAETDEVRRAIMKRSISGGEAAKLKVKALEDSVVNGAVKNGVPEPIARKMYENICYFSGYGFNRCVTSDTEVDTYYPCGGTMVSCTRMMKDLKPGDLVLSRSEATKQDVFVPVKQVHHNDVKKIVEVTLTTGEKVRCTLDHKFRVIETGEMLPLSEILRLGLSIMVRPTTSSVACAGVKSLTRRSTARRRRSIVKSTVTRA